MAMGRTAIGVLLALGSNAQDPNLVEFFRNWFPSSGQHPGR
jgi:hypothetical protein